MYRAARPGLRKESASHARDVTNNVIIEVQNGATSRIAFPCYYLYRKDGMPIDYHRIPHMVIDHFGWPSPDHRDGSWQPRIVDNLVVEPIHLTNEGYDQVSMNAYDLPDGFDHSVSIDDNVVRLTLNPRCDDAILEPVNVRFSVIATNSAEGMSDMVANGIIRILPALHMDMDPGSEGLTQ